MKFDLPFKENSGENFGEGLKEQLQKQALEATLKTLQSKIFALVCPEHGQSPKLKTSEGAGPGEQRMMFDCCCNRLRIMMEKVLKS